MTLGKELKIGDDTKHYICTIIDGIKIHFKCTRTIT